jgi:hypothetical protein
MASSKQVFAFSDSRKASCLQQETKKHASNQFIKRGTKVAVACQRRGFEMPSGAWKFQHINQWLIFVARQLLTIGMVHECIFG